MHGALIIFFFRRFAYASIKITKNTLLYDPPRYSVSRPASALLDTARQQSVLRHAAQVAQEGRRQSRITLAPLTEEEHNNNNKEKDVPSPQSCAPVLPPIRAKRRDRSGMEDIRYINLFPLILKDYQRDGE